MITAGDLKKINIFADWQDTDLEVVIPYLVEEEINKGQMLFNQGDIADKIYFIKSGCIELTIKVTESEERRLAQLKSGAMLGEMAVIDNKPRSATASAFVDTVLISITKEKFHQFIEKHGKETTNKLLINLIKELSFRLRAVDEEIRHMSLFT